MTKSELACTPQTNQVRSGGPARIAQGYGFAAAVLVAIGLALVMRLPFFLVTTYPLNDGGMFAQIVDEVRNHHFTLPHETLYNFEHIPLCYPPLGFYFGAIASAVFHQPAMEVLRWVPLLFNLASIPVVFLLALELLGEFLAATSALAVYAVLPRSSEWLTMGGGLTRSPGEFFAIVATWFFVRALKRDNNPLGVAAGVFTGVAILTHLEAGAFCVVSLLFLACASKEMVGANWRVSLRLLVIAGATSALVVGPWFLWAAAKYGLGPFRAAFGTRGFDGSSGIGIKAIEIMPWLALAAVMALFRQPPFVVWMLVISVFVARSSQTHTVLPLACFAGWLVLTLGDRLRGSSHGWFRSGNHASLSAASLCLIVSALWSANYLHHHLLPHDRLANLQFNPRATLVAEEVAAMQWVRAHTPPSARFLVYNQRSDIWAEDLVGEWFPYLAQRSSVLTPQGREWLPGGAFNQTLNRVPRTWQVFTTQDLVSRLGSTSFDYLFLAGPFDEAHAYQRRLLEQLPGFSKVLYRSGQIEVVARQ